jgi:integrase
MPRPRKLWTRPGRDYYYTKIDGKITRLEMIEKGEAASQRKLEKILRRMTEGPAGPDPTFALVADRFLEHSQATNDPETFEVHALCLLGPVVDHKEGVAIRGGGFVYHVGKKRPVSKVCEADLDAWLRKKTTWNDNTKVRARAVVLAALNYGVKKLNLPGHPLRHVRPGTVERREKVLTEKERRKIRAAAQAPFDDYMRALELTGARPFSEVAKVTAADVDLEKGTWTLARWKNSRKQKGKKRVIYLVPEMLEMTRRLVERRPEGPIFRNRNGKPWTRQALTARFRALGEAVGIEDLTAYAVRHGFITDALARGVPVAVVAELCGTSIQTIERHYNHMNVKHDLLRDAMRKAVG